jgi:hypothetical protein
MRRFLRVLAAGLGFGVIALPAAAGTHWVCGLSDDSVRLVCVADPETTAASSDPAPAEPGTGKGTVVHGTRFPLDASDVYTVELWSPPDDAQWLAQLARATICYRSPGCSVSVAPVQGLGATRPTAVAMRSHRAQR